MEKKESEKFCEKHKMPGYCSKCTGEERQTLAKREELELNKFRLEVCGQVDKSIENVFIMSKDDKERKICPHNYHDAQDCGECVSQVGQLKQEFLIEFEKLNKMLENDYWNKASEDGCDSRVEYEKEVGEEFEKFQDEIRQLHKEFFEQK